MKKTKRFVALICAFTMLCGLLAGCGKPAGDGPNGGNTGDTVTYKDEFVYALHAEIQNGDPFYRNATPDRMFASCTHESLLYYNFATYELEPLVAKEWRDVNGDAMTWEYKLNEGIKFHDGEGNVFGELTSADVKFTYEYAGQGGTGNVGFSIGAYAYVDSIECPDPYTVIFHLNAPAYDFPIQTSMSSKILCQKAFEEYDNPITAAEVGSGPYYLDYSRSMVGDHWTMTRFESYWRGTEAYPSKHITQRLIKDANSQFAALEAGEIDMALYMNAILAKQAEGNPDIVVANWSGSANTFLAFNYINSFDEEDSLPLRQAIAHAINRETLISMVYQGMPLAIPSHSFAIESTYGYVELENPYPYDLDKAKAIMNSLGYNENNRLTLKFGYKVSDQVTIEFLQASLKEIYIDAEAFVIDGNNHSQFLREGQGWDITVNYVGASPNMFYDFNRILHSAGNSNNMYGYNSTEYEALQAAAQSAGSLDETLAKFADLQEWVAVNIPFIEMYIPDLLIAYSANTEGVLPASNWQFMDLAHVAARK